MVADVVLFDNGYFDNGATSGWQAKGPEARRCRVWPRRRSFSTSQLNVAWVTAIVLVLTGAIFSAPGVITGIWAETFDQHAFVANVVITSLALVGGALYSPRSPAEP